MDLSTHFEELMQRSPISQNDMKSFLKEMRRTPSGTVAVSKLLAAKLQGPSEAQAIHAFDFLEMALESESEGSIEFRTEIGRYRFLNEIIRILSPKYLGDKTPEPVKERAVKFLEDAAGGKRKRWFPSEHSKVNSVYQSLIDGGVIQKPLNKLADEDAEFQKSIFERGENAVILKRLLQSKDPADLQAANRLIKNLVEEEARRNERRAELHSLIDTIETSVGLLTEMLSQPNIDKEIVDELVDTCRSLRQKLGGVATETNDEVTSLLQASENIEKVLGLYESKKDYISSLLTSGGSGGSINENGNAVASGGTASAPEPMPELSLADQLLMSLGDPEDTSSSKKQRNGLTSIEDSSNLLLNLDVDLGPGPSSKMSKDAEKDEPKLPVVEPFDEISKLSREMMEQGLKGIVPNCTQSKKTEKTPLNQLKRASQEQLPQNQNQTTSFPPFSVPHPPAHPITPQNSVSDSLSLLDLDFLERPSIQSNPNPRLSNPNDKEIVSKSSSAENTIKPQQHPESAKPRLSSSEDDNPLLVLEKEKSGESNKHNGTDNNNKNEKINKNDAKKAKQESTAQTITNSNGLRNGTTGNAKSAEFCLNSVRELDLEKIDLFDELKPLDVSLEESCKDVSLTLTFGSYPGLPSFVSIAVITFTNRSRSTGLLNYVFQLLPPKGFQVKLLPPVSMELPPWKKSFLPPPILTQVALIVIPNSNACTTTNASGKTLKMKFILSYSVEDETVLHNGEFSLPSCLLQ